MALPDGCRRRRGRRGALSGTIASDDTLRRSDRSVISSGIIPHGVPMTSDRVAAIPGDGIGHRENGSSA
jgi:hypothetical protein